MSQRTAIRDAQLSESLKAMEPNSYPAWLNHIQEIPKSPGTRQAFEALKDAATPTEFANAELKVTAAVLADVAAEWPIIEETKKYLLPR